MIVKYYDASWDEHIVMDVHRVTIQGKKLIINQVMNSFADCSRTVTCEYFIIEKAAHIRDNYCDFFSWYNIIVQPLNKRELIARIGDDTMYLDSTNVIDVYEE